MDYLVFVCKGSSRDLKKVIVSILKLGLAKNVKKMNYIQNYYVIDDKKIEKKEEKIIFVYTEKQDELLGFLSKNFPWIEKINIK